FVSGSVRDSPDAPTFVIRDIDLAIGSLRESHWTMGGLIWIESSAGESVGERLERSALAPVRQWNEGNAKTRLWSRRAIPRPVKRDEHTLAILRWKRGARVEQQRHG